MVTRMKLMQVSELVELRERVRFATRNYFLQPHEIDRTINVLLNRNPEATTFGARQFGKAARAAMNVMWDIGGGR